MTEQPVSAASRFALRFIATYRQEVSGSRGHVCGSVPSCSEYGELAYRSHGFARATILTLSHVARCRPPVAGVARAEPGEHGAR
jgi:putative component of membrane protein insertase Oxa1/YidC/SpoIIIJ protein YidD